jgi:hypothetical protein
MEREKITVWVTKWALTLGVIETDGEVIDEGMVGCGRKYGYFHGNDWHRTREAAVLRAEEMRLKKIASVKKQLEKMPQSMRVAIPHFDCGYDDVETVYTLNVNRSTSKWFTYDEAKPSDVEAEEVCLII